MKPDCPSLRGGDRCETNSNDRGETTALSSASPLPPPNASAVDGDSSAKSTTPAPPKPSTVCSMKAEVDAAVNFLTYLLVKARLNPPQAPEHFRRALTSLLVDRYAGHWYPAEPLKGSGFRCLRVNGVMHPLLANAAALCHIPFIEFRRAFPAEFTIWIDPGDVNVRIGEEGSIGVYFAKNSAAGAAGLSSSSAPTTPVSQVCTNKTRATISATVDGAAAAPHDKLKRSTAIVAGARVSPTVLFSQQPSATSNFVTSSSKYVTSPPKNLSPTPPFDGYRRNAPATTDVGDDPRFSMPPMVAPSSTTTAGACGDYYTLCGNVHVGGGGWRHRYDGTTTTAPSSSAITLTPTKRRSAVGVGAPARLAVEA